MGALLLLAVSVPITAAAQPVGADQSLVLDRWEITLGGFVTGLDTEVRFDEIAGNGGTSVNLEDDLGFDDQDTVLRLRAARLLGRRHQVGFNYFATERRGLVTADQEIQWGDEVFPVGSRVASFYDAEFVGIDYTYWLRSRERSAFGVTAGLVVFSLSSGADLIASADRVTVTVATDFSLDVPVPQIGLRYRRALGRRWELVTSAAFIVFDDIDDFTGDVITGDLALHYQAWRRVGLGGGFALQDFDIDSGEKRTLGNYRFELRGLYFYLDIGL